jgi:hypothetical protein
MQNRTDGKTFRVSHSPSVFYHRHFFLARNVNDDLSRLQQLTQGQTNAPMGRRRRIHKQASRGVGKIQPFL